MWQSLWYQQGTGSGTSVRYPTEITVSNPGTTIRTRNQKVQVTVSTSPVVIS